MYDAFSVPTPLGTLRCAATARGLALITLPGGSFDEQARALEGPRREVRDHPAARELRAYFAGRLHTFTVPLDLAHVTPFTRRVLEELASIPFGATSGYGEIARRIGEPRAARAVGGACGRNPVPVVIPCHRVVAASGRLGGFSARPAHKRALLAHEGHTITRDGRLVAAEARGSPGGGDPAHAAAGSYRILTLST